MIVTERVEYDPPKKMKCVAGRNCEPILTDGKIYDVVSLEPGPFFEDRPFYVFIDNSGKKCWAHHYRFELES